MTKRQKQEDENRENILRIRLTGSERKELDQTAKNNSLDTSTWARMELIRLARSKK